MSFAKFLSTNRSKLANLDPLFGKFIEDYFDDPFIQLSSRRLDIEEYLLENEASEETIESFDILYRLYRRTKKQEQENE